MNDLYVQVDGRTICNACNVRPDFLGEHRCFGEVGGQRCQCPEPLCRLQRREVTLVELEAEDPVVFGGACEWPKGCGERAEQSVVWPDGGEHPLCAAHARELADAVELGLFGSSSSVPR